MQGSQHPCLSLRGLPAAAQAWALPSSQALFFAVQDACPPELWQPSPSSRDFAPVSGELPFLSWSQMQSSFLNSTTLGGVGICIASNEPGPVQTGHSRTSLMMTALLPPSSHLPVGFSGGTMKARPEVPGPQPQPQCHPTQWAAVR